MKTLIIYSSFEDLPKFAIVEGDLSKFNNICLTEYIESDDEKQNLQNQLFELLRTDFGEQKIKFEDTFPFGQEFDHVINIGEIP